MKEQYKGLKIPKRNPGSMKISIGYGLKNVARYKFKGYPWGLEDTSRFRWAVTKSMWRRWNIRAMMSERCRRFVDIDEHRR